MPANDALALRFQRCFQFCERNPVNVRSSPQKPCLTTIVGCAQKLIEVLESEAMERPPRAAVLEAIEDGTIFELFHTLSMQDVGAIRIPYTEEEGTLLCALRVVISSDSVKSLPGTSGPAFLLGALHFIIQSGHWRRPEAWKYKI
jgi:hypothetical protein